MKFELQHTDTASDARAGLITTDHGQIQTPIFMPVGTCGTVKGVKPQRLISGREWMHCRMQSVHPG